MRDAEVRVSKGDYDEAVACCRRAVESVLKALSISNQADQIQLALQGVTDEAHAKVYSNIVAKLKELGNLSIHRSDAEGRYVRTEAIFVLGMTQQVVGLLSSLLRPRSPS